MKTLYKRVQFLVVVLLMATVAANAAAQEDRIREAMNLYFRATPMDHPSAERTALLARSETILLEVIEENPQSLDAHRKLMGVYLQMRDYRKAIQTMQAAITLAPTDPKLFIALAILYDHQGAYEYALPILNEALAIDPDQQLAREYRTSIQHKIEMRKLALENSGQHDIDKSHSR